MISYDDFLQTVTPEQAHMLATFAAQQRIYTPDAQEAAAFRADMAALLDARLLWRAMPGEEWRDGQRWYVFDGQVDPVAAAYCARLARERIEAARQVPVP